MNVHIVVIPGCRYVARLVFEAAVFKFTSTLYSSVAKVADIMKLQNNNTTENATQTVDPHPNGTIAGTTAGIQAQAVPVVLELELCVANSSLSVARGSTSCGFESLSMTCDGFLSGGSLSTKTPCGWPPCLQ